MSIDNVAKERISYEKLMLWTCIVVATLIGFFTVYNYHFPSEQKQLPAPVKQLTNSGEDSGDRRTLDQTADSKQ